MTLRPYQTLSSSAVHAILQSQPAFPLPTFSPAMLLLSHVMLLGIVVTLLSSLLELPHYLVLSFLYTTIFPSLEADRQYFGDHPYIVSRQRQ